MRLRFDEQLDILSDELNAMGALITHAISSASKAILERDVQAANDAIEVDHQVDRKERDIESLCLRLLLQQQPVARDLRQISAALKMITDMERIGDQASDIAGIAIYLAGKPHMKTAEHLPGMAREAIGMLSSALEAYEKKDAALAVRTIALDDRIDALFDTVKNELIDIIRSDADSGEQAIDLLMIAKYFERIGDHAENIAGWAEFAVTGRHYAKGERDSKGSEVR